MIGHLLTKSEDNNTINMISNLIKSCTWFILFYQIGIEK